MDIVETKGSGIPTNRKRGLGEPSDLMERSRPIGKGFFTESFCPKADKFGKTAKNIMDYAHKAGKEAVFLGR